MHQNKRLGGFGTALGARLSITRHVSLVAACVGVVAISCGACENRRTHGGSGVKDARAQLRAAIGNSSLSAYADELVASAAPSVRIRLRQPDTAIGASRFGGRPDLPSDFTWPRNNGKPLAFLSQINFAEIPDGPDRAALPARGSLVLFYDLYEGPWGYDPNHLGGWRVAVFPADAALERRPFPADLRAEWGYGQRGLSFEWEWLLPAPELAEFPARIRERINTDDQTAEAWRALWNDVLECGVNQHRLLGYPQPNQSDMRLECQLVTHGLYCGNSSGYDSAEAKALASGAKEWRLLLQIDTDDSDEAVPGWSWGDAGRLYYLVRDSDLRRGVLDQGWLIMQCF